VPTTPSTCGADVAAASSRRDVVAIESGSGLANATLQQRLPVPARLFYDFLMEEGRRESNSVGRGRYTPGQPGGRSAARPGAAAGEAAVDSRRAAVAAVAGGDSARAGFATG
jgi:hypothetical protein